MRRFFLTVIAGVCLCAFGYNTQVQAESKPKRHHESKLFHKAQPPVVQARPVATSRPAAARVTGHPIRDRLSPIIERTSNRYQQALLYKPNEQTTDKEQRQFAALLVQEAPGPGMPIPDNLRIGAVETDGNGRTVVDTSRPTIYTSESHVFLCGAFCEQRVCVWAYPGPEGKGPIWRGVRTTYAPNKYPILWELLASEDEPSILYVCSTIDKAAEKQYGKTPKDRQSHAERDLAAEPNVVVARILPPGADPAGPMVYMNETDHAVDTLLCRCMQPQVSQFVETAYYEMLPLDVVGNMQIAADGPFRLLNTYTPPVSNADQPWLEQALRLPKRF